MYVMITVIIQSYNGIKIYEAHLTNGDPVHILVHPGAIVGLHFINIHGLISLPCSGFGNVRMTCVSLPAQGERHIALISPKNLHAMREKETIRKLPVVICFK